MIKFFFSCFFISFISVAQMPETDIWLFKIEQKEGIYSYKNPLNITHRVGYDNQPTFSLDGKSIFYVCVDSSKQADIYQYSISKKTICNLTKSLVSEYSPTIMPDGKSFSAVVVEKDSTQRIWQFNMNGSFNQIIHGTTDSVGYHTWLSKDTVLYYKLSKPHSLRTLNINNGHDVWICDHPSRAFKKIGTTSQFIYAIKDSTFIQFRIYNPLLKESKLFAISSSSNEDFIWHTELGLIISDGSRLMNYNVLKKSWNILFDFSSLGIKKITRFVFDSKTKQLAIVSNL